MEKKKTEEADVADEVTQEDAMESLTLFNKEIQKLMNALIARFPKDATVARAHKRVNFAIKESPRFVIEAVGPHLLKYREQIDGRDANFFIKASFDSELKNSENEEKVKMVVDIMGKLKTEWTSLGAKDQSGYFDAVDSLLNNYLTYAIFHSD